MKILILFERFGPYHHARLRALGKVADTLALEISAIDDTYAWEKVERTEGFRKITLLDQPRTGQSHSALFRDIQVKIEEFQPDVIAVPGWSVAWSLFTIRQALRRDIPVVMMSESQKIDFQRFVFAEKLKRRVVKLCDAGLAGGTPHKEYLKDLGIPEDSLFTPYDVVDNHYFRAESARARKKAGALRKKLRLPQKYFLSSFRFIEKKNPIRLLKAFARYRKEKPKGWKLVLLGDGPLRRPIEKEIETLGLEGDVALPGFKQYGELPSYYALASAFILPSTTEQWGLVVNEAMACGLPVLVSERCGCAMDLVGNGENGFVFNPFNEEELAGLMLKMSQGSIDLVRMGRQSLERIKDWAPQNFAASLKKACEKAVENHRRPKSLATRTLASVSVLLNPAVFQWGVGLVDEYMRSKRGLGQVVPVIPNFFIIGAPKSGTTALSEYLKTHPNVYFSPVKEPHFFDKDMSRKLKINLPTYLDLFAKADPDIHKAIGEGSTGYLFSEKAVSEILQFNPNARFIVLLRNPVDLVPSWHSEMFFEGVENIPDFEQAWRAEKDRKEGRRIPVSCLEPQKLFYSDWGKLGDQVERLYSRVPRDRVKVVLFDDFVADTRKVYEETLSFLNLPSDRRSHFEPVNESKELKVFLLQRLFAILANSLRLIRARSGLKLGLGLGIFPRLFFINSRIAKRIPLSPVLKEELRAYFRQDVQKLSRLIGRDLGYWVEPARLKGAGRPAAKARLAASSPAKT